MFPKNSLTIFLDEEPQIGAPRIKVIGVGGAGIDTVNRMMEEGVKGCRFVAMHTNKRHLLGAKASDKVQLGPVCARGEGAGGDPSLGEEAARESHGEILDILEDTDMIFLTAGFGKGTGTGATPYIVSQAIQKDILTVAVITTPFDWEGQNAVNKAHSGLHELRKNNVDALIVIPKDNLKNVITEDANTPSGFKYADMVLCDAVRSISDIITLGASNVDFSDIKRLLRQRGQIYFGMGEAQGEGRALDAVKLALKNPLLEGAPIENAKELLVAITGENEKMRELTEIGTFLRETIKNDDAVISWAHIPSKDSGGVYRVALIASGFDQNTAQSFSPQIYSIGKYALSEGELPTPKTIKSVGSAPKGSTLFSEQKIPSYNKYLRQPPTPMSAGGKKVV